MILLGEVASASLRLTFGVESLQDYHFFCLYPVDKYGVRKVENESFRVFLSFPA